MPLTGPTSFVPTMRDFAGHWGQINTVLTGMEQGEMVLKGGFTLSDFNAAKQALEDDFTAIIRADRDFTLNLGTLKKAKSDARERLTQFRKAVLGYLAGTRYETSLPILPPSGAQQSAYLKPFDDALDIWGRLDSDTSMDDFKPPLLLADGYTLAQFREDVTALRTAFEAGQSATEMAGAARRSRDGHFPGIRARLKQFRSIAPVRLGTKHVLVATMPAMTPPPGKTPKPVSLTGTWDTMRNQAVFSWTASDDAALDHYALRYVSGPKYKAADEIEVAVIPAGTTTFATDAGLTLPDTVASFKIYVVVKTGNERGSQAVKISRPAS